MQRSLAILTIFLLTTLGGVASASTVWIFGDSLNDTGALRAATGPYQLPPDPPYPGGRRSNGDVWVDYLRSDYGKTNFVNASVAGSITGTVNVGGFEVDNLNDLFLFQLQAANMQAPFLLPDVIGLQEQANRFVGTTNNKDVGVIWAGANDFFAAVLAGFTRTPQQVAADIGAAATTLYTKGLNDIVIGNLPDLGKVPLIPDVAKATFTALTDGFNLLLQQVAMQLMGTLPGLEVSIVDINSAFEDLLTNRAAGLGISELTDPCLTGITVTPMLPICSDPSKRPNEYVFYDLVHPTSIVHREIANEFAPFLDLPQPGLIWLLLAGFGAYVVRGLGRRTG